MKKIELLKEGDSDTLLSATRANEIVAACNHFLAMQADKPLYIDKSGAVWRISIDPNVLKDPDDLNGGGGAFPNIAQSATATCHDGTTGTPLTVTIPAGTIYADTRDHANQYALYLAMGQAQSQIVCSIGGIDDEIVCMDKLSTGDIVICGNFKNVYGYVRQGLALLDTNFNLKLPCWKFDMSNPGGDENVLLAVCVDSSDKIYVCANGFTAVDLLPWNSLAQVEANGGVTGGYLAPAFTPRTFVGSYPQFVFRDYFISGGVIIEERIIVLGGFNNYNGTAVAGAFSLKLTDGTIDTTAPFTPSGWSCALTAEASYGMMTNANDYTHDTDAYYVWNVTATASGKTNTVIKCDDGGNIVLAWVLSVDIDKGPAIPFGMNWDDIAGTNIICGHSTWTNPTPPHNTQFSLIRVDNLTGAYIPFSGGATTGFDATCLCVGVQSTGKIVCVGEFSHYNGTAVGPYICRVNPDGTLDATFTAFTNDIVHQVIIEPGDNILICGDLTQANGVTKPRIARMDPNGTLI